MRILLQEDWLDSNPVIHYYNQILHNLSDVALAKNDETDRLQGQRFHLLEALNTSGNSADLSNRKKCINGN